MHLKTLTLRGFKSFASATTLRFEPGITCVVGPNGSGKSNVIDALAWVMGEQGAKTLRGGKMEDVIFAGTAGRPPLGRAEVVLTIDNTDGALPIEYAEVTISRIMFAGGGSEYAINGQTCRLLDVQELLSDSGIGREMHVIVGQGQLDGILHATPEERRGFLEEAAGVLKHRKRKEKALRKLDAMAANLTRLEDLTAELRRQLKPLGRQAELARRAVTIQADRRDARLRLLADDLLQLRLVLDREVADETALRTRRTLVESELATAQAREHELETATREQAPHLARAQETWYRLSSLRERVRGTESVARERSRNLADDDSTGWTSSDPDELDAQARAVRADEADVAAQLRRETATLTAAEEALAAVETALSVEETRLAALVRAAADRREGRARLVGQVDALRSRVAAAEAEIGRLVAARTEAGARAEHARREFTALESRIAGLDAGEVDLDTEHERASTGLAEADERLHRLRDDERSAERERASLVARTEALGLGLRRKDGAAAVLAAGPRVSGVLGSVAALLQVETGWQSAVAAALGAAADAVAVDGIDSALGAVAVLKDDDAGRAAFLVGATPSSQPGSSQLRSSQVRPSQLESSQPRASWPPLPEGVRYALDAVRVPTELHGSVEHLLSRVALVEGMDAARDLVTAVPGVRAVTRDGDLVGPGFVAGGSAAAPSLLEVQAAREEAIDDLAAATRRCERLRFELAEAAEQHQRLAAALEASLARLHESDARLAAVAEQLGHLGATARAAAGEVERMGAAIAEAESRRDAAAAGLEEMQARLVAVVDAPADDEPDPAVQERLETAVRAGRAAEIEARLAVRTGEERVRALGARADMLERTAAEERDRRDRAARLRVRRARQAFVATVVADAAATVLDHLERSLATAAEARRRAEVARSEREEAVTLVRARTRELAADLERLVDSVHRDEVARAEQRLRIENLENVAVAELGVDPETLLAEYGPEIMVPPSPVPLGDEPAGARGDDEPAAPPHPYVRDEQEKRLRTAERSLAVLGRVNPLALEEYAALEERQAYLADQLEDLKATRRDLLGIVREVDDRVQQVFAAAYEDTAREFELVFARLFPGGEGRLVLTDPDDMLATGVDVEARPAGKRVKRLSLLSGGERSLTAVALLVAIFRARPSPFYVLDEVEAALDDTNLSRLLGIFEELRETSQLVIVTHQKRTMEIADALYGVTMRGDGETTVISQRLRDAASA